MIDNVSKFAFEFDTRPFKIKSSHRLCTQCFSSNLFVVCPYYNRSIKCFFRRRIRFRSKILQFEKCCKIDYT